MKYKKIKFKLQQFLRLWLNKKNSTIKPRSHGESCQRQMRIGAYREEIKIDNRLCPPQKIIKN